MKNFFIYSIIILSIFSSHLAFGDTKETTGLITESVWFSSESPKEGDSIKIYTAVWNGENSKIFTKVEFYDKNVVLGNREIEISPEEIKEVSLPFKATSGDHNIYAKIVSAQILNSKGIKEKIVLSNSKTEENKITISKTVVDTKDGETKTSEELIKDELGKAGDSFTDSIPESVKTPVSNAFKGVEDFRLEKLDEVSQSKVKAKEKVESLKDSEEMISGTDKPIAELRHIFLSGLEFILNNKIVFYGILVLLVFYILRFIFKKII